MSLDPAGEWGLRFRIRVAIGLGYNYDTLAIILGITPERLAAYLRDPATVLTPEEVASVIAGLPDIVPSDVWYDRHVTPGGIIITYVESPFWTDDQLDNIAIPPGASTFKVHFLAPSEQHRVMSTPTYALDTFDPAEVARDATAEQLDRLVAIVFYEYPNP